eukprot:maker-scaffold339_size202159-snap-gene-1.20 protein:Tk01771 transcript:maker-scaffold339_size202159-snap-gene-1.20-mRNA-1 annotation:"atp-dependent rna helicase tdrd9"
MAQDILDFFDLSRNFEADLQLDRPGTRARVKMSALVDTPDPWATERAVEASQDSDTPTQPYYVEYRERERRDHEARCQSERAAAWGGAGGAPSVTGSHMTGIEAVSMGASSFYAGRPEPDGRRDEGLLQRYNFHVDTSSKRRHKLPILDEEETIVNKINSSQVTIISGYTGCGKTTQVPQFILNHAAHNQKHVNIVVTQPRRIAAKTVARRVCQERDWPLGKLVGYKIGLDKEFVSPDTRLLYCTTGMLKKMIINKKSLNEWTHVILDEVHEREQDMDFVLLLCKKLINTTSRGVKLILMSATLNLDKLCEYFERNIPNTDVVESPGLYELRTTESVHKVIELYLDDLASFYPENWDEPDLTEGLPALHEANVRLCKVIIQQLEQLERNSRLSPGEPKPSVIVFLPGEAEILRVKQWLKQDGVAEQLKWRILVLHSRIPLEDIDLVFDPAPLGFRKVILATNVAESSITIPDVGYIIDFCLTKILVTDPDTNYVSLQMDFADKNSCRQRAGRTGRVAAGRVFRLVRRSYYDNYLSKEHRPEMQRAPLDKLVLETKLLNFGSPKELLALALDPPELTNICKTVMHLKVIGAVHTTFRGVPIMDDGDLTPLGEIIAGLPVDVRLGKFIVFGQLFNVLEEAVIIAAGLSNKSIFATPMEEKIAAYACKLRWAQRTFSDCFAVLYAYTTWSKHKREGFFKSPTRNKERQRQFKWCRDRFLQLKCLEDMEKTIDEIKVGLKRLGIEHNPMPNRPRIPWSEKVNLINYAIFGSFYPNYFVKQPGIRDQREVHKLVGGRNPAHSVYFMNWTSSQSPFGAIYEDQIKDFFKPCGIPKEKLHVEFEASRVIVHIMSNSLDREFDQTVNDNLFNESSIDNNLNLTGEIIHQVYVAMKLKFAFRRERRFGVSMEVHSDRGAAIKFKEHLEKKIKAQEAVVDPTDYTTIGQIPAPSLGTKDLKVTVVHVNHPNSFFVHLFSSSASQVMSSIEDAIDNVLKMKLLKAPDNIFLVKIGQVCITEYKDEIDQDDQALFYRARIDGVYEKAEDGSLVHFSTTSGRNQRVNTNPSAYMLKVYFIDYGNEALKSAQDIHLIPPSVLRNRPNLSQPAQALECTLNRVKPNPIKNPQGTWTQDVINSMGVLIGQDFIQTQVYSVIARPRGPLLSLIVFTTDGKCFNDELKGESAKGHPPMAIEGQESYISHLNHQNRSQEHLLTPELVQDLEADQTNYLAKKYTPNSDSQMVENIEEELASWHAFYTGKMLDDSREVARTTTINLKGPNHPLEAKVSHLTKVGESKEVRIEPDSVNAILLDQNPGDDHDHWMVAAFVGLTPDGDKVMARSTTFLPFHHGLGSILSMIFAPQVELRCDKLVRRYTGAICGLGTREKDWGMSSRLGQTAQGATKRPMKISYHSDQDMELVFDVNIDNYDIQQIQKVRYWINQGFVRDSGYGSGATGHQPIGPYCLKMQQEQHLVNIQDSIRFHMSELVNRMRTSPPKTRYPKEYRWCGWPSAEKINRCEINDSQFVLKNISTYNLSAQGPSAARDNPTLLRLLKQFEGFAERPQVKIHVRCPICSHAEVLYTGAEVGAHLRANGHHSEMDRQNLG